MNSISVNKFRDNIKSFVEQVVTEPLPTTEASEDGKERGQNHAHF